MGSSCSRSRAEEEEHTDRLGRLPEKQRSHRHSQSRRSTGSTRVSVSLDGLDDDDNARAIHALRLPEPVTASKKALSHHVESASTWPEKPSTSSDADWIYAIYGTLDVPPEMRASFRKEGFTMFGRFILTGVKGTTKDGRTFEWSTRRQRKGLGPIWTDDPVFQAKSLLEYFAWLYKPQRFHHSPQLAVSYWGALSFFVGGFLFMLSNLAQIFPQAAAPMGDDGTKWGHNLYDWLGPLPACIGLYLVMVGHVCKYFEVLNASYPRRLDKYHRGVLAGKPYRKPRYKLLGSRPTSVGWYGAVLRLWAGAFFCWASLANVLNQSSEVNMQGKVQGWVIYFPFVMGPAFLALGGLFIIWECSGKLWKGFIPLSFQDLASPVFWNGLLGFWGALGLLAGGICQWNNMHFDLTQQRMYRAIAYFAGGSFLIWCSSVTLLFELSSPHIVSSYIHGAIQNRLLDKQKTMESGEEAC